MKKENIMVALSGAIFMTVMNVNNVLATGHWRKQSHPSWVCGLKHQTGENGDGRYAVTPFVGVWIETHLHG